MIKSLLLTSLAFLTLGIDSGVAPPPDLCAELNSATGYPSFCEPTGPDAPWWDQEVCCDGAKCVEPSTAGCPQNMRSYSCEFAELDIDGKVTCLFEVPSYCDTHECPAHAPAPGFQAPPEENVMCCYAEGCYDPLGDDCGGILYWCDDGVTNESGTVTCFDPGTPDTD